MVKIKSLEPFEKSTATYVVADNELLTVYGNLERDRRQTIVSEDVYLNHKKSEILSESFKKTYFEYSKAVVDTRRQEWYDLISSDYFKPRFDIENGVSFFTSHEAADSHHLPYKVIEDLVSAFIFRTSETTLKKEEVASVTDSILMACSQLLRYLPEFEKRRPHYFIDSHSSKLGVMFQKYGTLTILIGSNSEIEYSYAHKQKVGTVRMSGTAKLTKSLHNSKFIRKLIRLQGMSE